MMIVTVRFTEIRRETTSRYCECLGALHVSFLSMPTALFLSMNAVSASSNFTFPSECTILTSRLSGKFAPMARSFAERRNCSSNWQVAKFTALGRTLHAAELMTPTASSCSRSFSAFLLADRESLAADDQSIIGPSLDSVWHG